MISVHQEKFDSALAALVDMTPGAASAIIKDEARFFLKQTIAFTPPKNKEQGENAIASDAKKLFQPVDSDFYTFVQHQYGNRNVNQWLIGKDSKDRYNIQWGELTVVPQRMEAIHASQRNSRGRVVGGGIRQSKTKWTARFVTTDDALAEFIARVQKHVGYMKSGWVKAYQELGGKVPGWISRHAPVGFGTVKNELNHATFPKITMGNHAPGAVQQERAYSDAFRARSEAIRRKIKLMVSGYSKDVAAGMRIRKPRLPENPI